MKKLVLIAALVLSPAALAAKVPPPSTAGDAVHYLESKGLTVDARFSVPGGLHGYAASTPIGKHVVFYTTADGKLALFGILLDSHGHNLTKAYEHNYVQTPENQHLYGKLAKLHWIEAGAKHPRRIVYAFVDPNCPYCWHFWKAAQKAYSQGVQVRYIVVGILGDSSVKKAATILDAKNPRTALQQNERGFKNHSGAAKPMDKVPDKIRSELADHARLMQEFGIDGTPGLIWKDSSGKVQTSDGLPPNDYLEKHIFGLGGK